MAFPFKDTPHRLYKNTFLQNVFASISFETGKKQDTDAEIKDKLHSFIKFQFGLDVRDSFPEEPMALTSSDGMLSFLFSKNVSSVKVGARNYRSFDDSVVPQILKIEQYIEVLKLMSIQRLSLRKINIWPVLVNNLNELDANKIVSEIFSTELLKSKPIEFDSSDENLPLLGKYIWSDEALQVTIRTAFINDENEELKGRLILDIEAALDCITSADAIRSQFSLLNSTLFNAYCWSVRPEILKIMEGEK